MWPPVANRAPPRKNFVSCSANNSGRSYTDVKVEFKTLEDLDTIVNVGGANMAMARYALARHLQSRRHQRKSARHSAPPARPKK